MTETPPRVEHLTVPGLSAEAEIVVDAWGIPHLRAGSEDDLFFLQGFNAARDRLWQIDLWRKRGLGLLARDFGPGYLAQDRASRAFLYRGDMAAEWASYAPDAEAIVGAFVRGINAYVALTRAEPDRLPEEFRALGTRPDPWRPEDVVRIRSHALTRNALSEVLRARILSRHGAEADRLRKEIEPPVVPGNPGGLDLATIPLAVLDLVKLATAAVTFSPERLAARLDEAEAWTRVTDLGDVVRDAALEGSNNWAVAGSRTATGRPILAGDPHRAHAVPSLRYLVHLSAPGFDAIGAGEPAVPGISMGHNGTAAFAITIFYADQEDVYVYDTEPGAPERYRYGDGFEAMTQVEEAVPVKGAPDQPVTLRFTRHGPVLFADANRAFALRTVWSEPGSAAYLASLSTMRATSLPAYRAAARRWGTPSLNHVYADAGGTVSWFPAGYAPIRPNWDGLLPVPGDGRFEWAGLRSPDTMPAIADPAEGFVQSANEMNLPPDFQFAQGAIGYEWVEASRANRIKEVLGAAQGHDVADSCALQTDATSLPARRLAPLFAALARGVDADRDAALALLAGWDHVLAADSGAALLHEYWWTRHLKPGLFALHVPDAGDRALLQPGDVGAMLAALEAPGPAFGATPPAGRDRLLGETLAAAYRDLVARFGPETAAWRWGDLHHGGFTHALSATLGAEAGARLDLGPLPKGGSSSTVMNAGYRGTDFRVTTGASVRFVIDVGDWDRSVCVNAPGQSGDPASPHYRDLAPLWAAGGYVPMLYGRAAVDAAARVVIRLAPAPGPR